MPHFSRFKHTHLQHIFLGSTLTNQGRRCSDDYLDGNGGRENGKDSTRECERKQVALWSEAGRHSKDLSFSIAKVGLNFFCFKLHAQLHWSSTMAVINPVSFRARLLIRECGKSWVYTANLEKKIRYLMRWLPVVSYLSWLI